MKEFELPDPITDDQISGEEKLYRVTKLIQELRDDFEHVNLLPFERNAYMEQLKVFGRNPKNAEPIFTPAGIEIITHHSFHSTSPTTSKAALQCLANALLAEPVTRQYFVDLGYSERAVKRLKKPQKDDEFLMSRILFLTSYGTSQRFDRLIDKSHLADYVVENIERHAKNKAPNRHDDEALNETLKLVFNIAHFCPSHASAFSKAIPNIMKTLSRRPLQMPPLASPTNLLINALINMPTPDKKAINNSNLEPCIKQLLKILDSALQTYPDHDLDATIIPLITLLKRLAKYSPPPVIAAMKFAMLPDPSKTGVVFPGPDSLHARLVDHLENPRSQALYDGISALFLDLVGGDTRKLTTTVGLSFTAGFVMTRAGQMPRSGRSSVASASTGSARSIELKRKMSNQEEAKDVTGHAKTLSASSTSSSVGVGSSFGNGIANGNSNRVSSSTADTRTHRSMSSTASADALMNGGEAGRKGSVSASQRLSLERKSSRPRVDTERLMVLFDRLKVTNISNYDDPRMRAAARDMVVKLDEDAITPAR